MNGTAYFTGLDLGQSQDYSALVVVEQCSRAGEREHEYRVRHLHRWNLGTSYPAIVADVAGMFSDYPLRDSTLVIDATGVGRPVVDMVTNAGLRATVKALSITAGNAPGEATVPKKDLVGAVQAAIQSRRLKIAEGLPLAATLAREMEQFRVKVTADRNETFASWRERDHDDLLLALALAIWYGERHPGNQAECYSKPRSLPPGIHRGSGLPEAIWR
ncbi:MAG: hypothetical protein U0791_18475 [Gemmataceae bacterium]